MFGFGKKKEVTEIQPTHYEGLTGFKQEYPCFMKLEDEYVTFKDDNGTTLKLPYERILTVDLMKQENFMAKYHNNKSKTTKGNVLFRVITYVTAAGETKYIALWDVSFKSPHFYSELEARIKKQPTKTIL